MRIVGPVNDVTVRVVRVAGLCQERGEGWLVPGGGGVVRLEQCPMCWL